MNPIQRFLQGMLVMVVLSGCSTGQMVVRGSQSIMDSSMETMNRETDLVLARDSMPANLKMIEGMLVEDPGNTEMRLYAAQGFYGYAFGFIELEDPQRAAAGVAHDQVGLQVARDVADQHAAADGHTDGHADRCLSQPRRRRQQLRCRRAPYPQPGHQRSPLPQRRLRLLEVPHRSGAGDQALSVGHGWRL